MKNILIVDDEDDIRQLISDILTDEGYNVSEAYSVDSAVETANVKRPELVLLDMCLKNDVDGGMTLLNFFKDRFYDIPVIMISAHGNIEMAVDAIKKGAYDFIEKPFKTDQLLVVIERAFETYMLRRENQILKQKRDDAEDITLIGKSFYINNLKQIINKIAPTNSRVLITGPAGSGKEIVARNIHAKSDRKDRPFLIISSANLTNDNFDEKIYGKDGIVRNSGQGVVLIDEITDMPMQSQGRLVKFIQDNVADMRIMATSSRNLREAIASGHLREDLYYRLNVVPIETMALKDRRDDIDAFCTYFMKKLIGKDITFTTGAKLILSSYPWPGNIRELMNTMARIVILHKDEIEDKIDVELLPKEINGQQMLSHPPFDIEALVSLPLKEAKDAFEREYLEAEIARFEGNISQTAKFIGMDRSALHKKLKQLGVNTEK